METYKNIDEFIKEASIVINKEEKSLIAELVEIHYAEFDENLKAIIEGADETEVPAPPDEKQKNKLT